ncbi:retrovirus-related Pol polyprotein from type-1 retrotransposable element R2 [Nephila pilipes]|uniref:Retrovirus-related Pol polyprotein from type-1 retrotransposable element R2 n=1 Tax=Nephila pilipes TaxID=299642 RepID=A0A8X6IW59_NEPPI|nr:retrovirus-related Pol polyprotein from type-1 retrotransposable element R2 [Nephila pilipes]
MQRFDDDAQLQEEAKVVLIPKPGDLLDISNWRPVSLLNTGGKVFSSVLAARISSWANINSRLSPFQKGFRENDGCSEHNFILEQAITGAKRLHLDLSMAWLDLENAFGSVPHRFILEALGHAGVPSSTVAIISAIYTGSTSTIRTSAGWTGPIPMRAGVRQGCPLSAILFNLSLEQILRTGISAPGFRLYGQEVKCLAYADDLLLLGQSPVDLQDNINSICGVAALAGLRFKPSKCASLSFNYTGNKRSIDDASFLVAGTRIRNIKDQEAYKYLGVRVGLSYKQDNTEFFRGITRDVKLVAASPLAPWQKLTAIRAHVLSRAEFLCRNSHIQKRDVADLDKTLISTGKRILNLPTRANVNLVHLSTNKGGAALPHFRALLDVHAISHAFRLLASDDQLTSDVAFAGLRGVVRKKILRDPTPSECAEFLNGNKAGDFARESGDLSTLWSRARQAADRLFKFIKFSWTFNEELGCFNLNIYRSPNPVCVVPSTAGLVARLLRDDLESFYIKQLSSLVDQGKTVEVFSQHPASNHFLQAGDFTRFCDWNFIHRARLGCLQLNATMRFSKRNPKCRKCGYVRETIPHVLNHCKPHSDAWKRRHDAIQNRVARAISSSVGSVSINKKFPGIAQTLIPDMVLTKKSGSVEDISCNRCVSGAISSHGVFGPIFIDGTLSAANYRKFLNDEFILFLHGHDLVQDHWIMQDGAKPHRTADVFEVLNEHFSDRIIGLDYPSHFQGGIERPPYSPDLNPCDYYLWGYLKSKVWQTSPTNLPELKTAITTAVDTIDSEACTRVMVGFQNRLTAVLVKDGGHFEPLYH